MPARKLQIRDNPNPAANIGFICYVPLNFYVFKNVYKHLPNSEFIVGEPHSRVGMGSQYLENLLDFFSEQDVYWRFIDKGNPVLYEKEFYDKYAVLVSTWYRGPLQEPFNKEKKTVSLLYGHAKDLWNYGPWRAYFDLVLSYGPYSQGFLSIYGNSVIVGNPKFDDWFAGKVDPQLVSYYKSRLDSLKRTILYLPTHGILSSIDLMATAINQLSKKYNIVLKAHHDTHLFDGHRIEPYRGNPNILVTSDRDDIQPLLKVSDITISDSSGAIFEAALADKPIILVDFLDDEFFETFRDSYYYQPKGRYGGVATREHSLEQQVKLPGKEIGPIIQYGKPGRRDPYTMKGQVSVARVEQALIEAEQRESLYSRRRKKTVIQAFAFNDGRCGQRAAKEIMDLLYKPKPRKTFLAEALERYLNELSKNNPERRKKSV